MNLFIYEVSNEGLLAVVLASNEQHAITLINRPDKLEIKKLGVVTADVNETPRIVMFHSILF